MDDLEGAVAGHYSGADIARGILTALREAGHEAGRPTPGDLAPLDQFHARGLAATRDLAALLSPAPGAHLLDIGAGIGGPARIIAEAHDCRVTGIDLTPAFVEAALALTEATGQRNCVGFECASALALPFEDTSFDAAYSQNVIMNIADRPAFYAEAARVLKPGARLALSNVAQGAGGPPYFPVPWAETAATNFLATAAETRAEIAAAGLEVLHFEDMTTPHLAFYDEQRERVRREGPPKLGIHVLMGERMKEMQRNSARSVAEGRVLTLEILAQKPGAA